MFFYISDLLERTDVVDSLHGLLCFLVPLLHISVHCKCHESVFLELEYPCSE
jgi:hypothetical protein